MSKQELHLLELTPGTEAETDTGSAKLVRCHRVSSENCQCPPPDGFAVRDNVAATVGQKREPCVKLPPYCTCNAEGTRLVPVASRYGS